MSALPIQIVPTFPPTPGGVGDYACRVEREGAFHSETRWRFVTAERARAAAEGPASEGVTRLAERTPEALLEALEPAADGAAPTVVLHCSGYGYAANGAPAWLLDGMERFLARHRAARFGVVFHELYATSPPWRRAFWHSHAQRAVARGFARLARRALCTTQTNRAIVHAWNPSLEIDLLAIASNMGEPEEVRPWAERAPRLLVFGLAGTRARLYRDRALLRQVCETLGIEQVEDVGPDAGALPDLGRPLVRHGTIDITRFAALAAGCRYGALHYTAGPLAKSGVFAAYCAHGLAPIVAARPPVGDALAPGVHYAPAEALRAESAAGPIAAAARAWYQGHRISMHARWLQSLC